MTRVVGNQGRQVMTEATARKTVEQYFEEARSCVGDLHRTIHRFGGVLIEAGKMLTKEEYDDLVTRIKTSLGLPQAEITAAMRVSDGTLEEEFFFSGPALSKILTLSGMDRGRLKSGEKFPLLMSDGSRVKKAWSDMTVKERDQLLGPKGGGIRTVDQQRNRSAGSKSSKPKTYTSASFNSEEDTLVLRDGSSKGEIELGVIVHSLQTKEQLDKFKAALEAKIEEMAQLVA